MTVTPPTETTETTRVAQAPETSDAAGPNWMLILISLITAITALWEALAVRGVGPTDLWGYLLLGVGMFLFAAQNILWAKSHALAARFHIPAVVLTLIGVTLLVLSNTAGRRI